MMTATQTRAEARKHLAGKWNRGALIAFCYFIVESILELIGNGLNQINAALYSAYQIVFFIISVPISYGFIVSFIKLKRGESVEAFDFLKIGFSNFSRAWSIAWNKFLKMIVPVIVMVISLILIGIAVAFTTTSSILSKTTEAKNRLETQNNYSLSSTDSNYSELQSAKSKLDTAKERNDNSMKNALNNSNNKTLTAVLLFTAFIVYIVCIFFLAVKSLSLSLSSFIAYDNDDMSGKESCELSQKLMKGNKGNLFVLSLSFIGWAILTVFTLGIGSFWLTAYMNVSVVCFYDAIADKNTEISNKDKEEEIV